MSGCFLKQGVYVHRDQSATTTPNLYNGKPQRKQLAKYWHFRSPIPPVVFGFNQRPAMDPWCASLSNFNI